MRDDSGTSSTECGKAQCRHFLIELLRQEVDVLVISKDGKHGAEYRKVQCRDPSSSGSRKRSTMTPNRKRQLSTEPYSSTTVVSTLERAFMLDTCS